MTDYTHGVDATLLAKVGRVLTIMLALGHPMRIYQGLRSEEQQHALWLKGRSSMGGIVDATAIVTNADGLIHRSNHQDGRAVDCCFQGDDPFLKLHPHAEDLWYTFAALVTRVGLKSGADFSIVDWGHAELPGLPPSKGPTVLHV